MVIDIEGTQKLLRDLTRITPVLIGHAMTEQLDLLVAVLWARRVSTGSTLPPCFEAIYPVCISEFEN
jgi:hypothetical protein